MLLALYKNWEKKKSIKTKRRRKMKKVYLMILLICALFSVKCVFALDSQSTEQSEKVKSDGNTGYEINDGIWKDVVVRDLKENEKTEKIQYGVVIEQVREGSIWINILKIKEGDIIIGINDYLIDNLKDLEEFEIDVNDSIEIEFIRDENNVIAKYINICKRCYFW